MSHPVFKYPYLTLEHGNKWATLDAVPIVAKYDDIISWFRDKKIFISINRDIYMNIISKIEYSYFNEEGEEYWRIISSVHQKISDAYYYAVDEAFSLLEKSDK